MEHLPGEVGGRIRTGRQTGEQPAEKAGRRSESAQVRILRTAGDRPVVNGDGPGDRSIGQGRLSLVTGRH